MGRLPIIARYSSDIIEILMYVYTFIYFKNIFNRARKKLGESILHHPAYLFPLFM